jgi:small subunit ribosomal protein S4e
MANRGGAKHVKRTAAPKTIPISDKKSRLWITKTSPGPHPKKQSMPLLVLLRDVLKVAETGREIGKVLSARAILVDGKPRTDKDFPVGFMDLVSIPSAKKAYRMVVDYKGRLVPIECKDSNTKLVKVTGKTTVKGGKLTIHLHDGKCMFADNNVKVGDSLTISLPKLQLKSHLKLHKGARCIIREGKHAGTIVKLKDIITRQAGKVPEALVQAEDGGDEFITVAKYLFVVDDGFSTKGSG